MCRRYWFAYTGYDGGENSANFYTLLTLNPNTCPPGNHLCAVYVCMESGSNPEVPISGFLSENIRRYIADGKTSETAQPSSRPKYVYVRTAS